MLQWLRLQSPALAPLDQWTCEAAAGGGHLAVLQWAREQDCPWDESTCAAAAYNGHLAVLTWARHHGCAWNSNTCKAAAAGGHLAVLQYAHQNGCDWGPHVCSTAAEHGHLSLLKWLRQKGCPWDCRTTCMAAFYNHREVLKWARQQQPACPWWPRKYLQSRNLHPGVLVFLRQQQAPLSATHLACGRATATEMIYAVLSLRAALPDRTTHEVVLNIVSLAFS